DRHPGSPMGRMRGRSAADGVGILPAEGTQKIVDRQRTGGDGGCWVGNDADFCQSSIPSTSSKLYRRPTGKRILIGGLSMVAVGLIGTHLFTSMGYAGFFLWQNKTLQSQFH